jgi:hypothetical protein
MFGGQGLSIKVIIIIIIFFFLRFVIVIKNYCMAVLFDLTSVMSVHSMLFQLQDFTLSFTIFDVQIHLFFKVLFYN